MNHVEKLADSIMRRIEDEKAIHRDSLIDEINGAIAKANQPSPVYVLAADAREKAQKFIREFSYTPDMCNADSPVIHYLDRLNDPLGGM